MQKSRIDILNGGSGKQIGADKSEQKIIGRSHAKGGVDVKHASGEDYELEGGEVVDGDRVFSVKLKSQSGESFAAVAESLLKAKKKANSALKVASAQTKDKIRKKIKGIEAELTALFNEQQEMNGDSSGEYAAEGTEMGAEIMEPAAVETTTVIDQPAQESVETTTLSPVIQQDTNSVTKNTDPNSIVNQIWDKLSSSNQASKYKGYTDFLIKWNQDPRSVYEDVLSKSDKSGEFKDIVSKNYSFLLSPVKYPGSDMVQMNAVNNIVTKTAAPAKNINPKTGYTVTVTDVSASGSTPTQGTQKGFTTTKDGLVIPKVDQVKTTAKVETPKLDGEKKAKVDNLDNSLYSIIYDKLQYTKLSGLFENQDDLINEFKKDPNGTLEALKSDKIALSAILPELKKLYPTSVSETDKLIVSTPYGFGNKPMVPTAEDYPEFDDEDFVGHRLAEEKKAKLGAIDSKDLTKEIKPGFAETLFESAQRGFASLAQMISNTPAYAYDAYVAAPLNFLADKVGLDVEFSADKLGNLVGVEENKISNYYGDVIKSSQKRLQDKYDKDLVGYLQSGDYDNFFGLLANQIVESAPTSIAIAVTSAAGLPTSASVAGFGTVFAAGKKAELNEDPLTKDLPESTKNVDASLSGIFEGVFEQWGITKLGGAVKDLIKGKTKEEAMDIAKSSFLKVYAPILGRYFSTTGEEMLGEMATQFAQNATDKYLGIKPDLDLLDNVVNAGIVGLGSSAAMTTPVTLAEVAITKSARDQAKSIKKQKDIINQNLENPNVGVDSKKAMSKAYLDLNQKESEVYNQQKKEMESLPDPIKEQVKSNINEINDLENAINDPNVSEDAKITLQERIDDLNTTIEDTIKQSKKEAEVKVEEVLPAATAETVTAEAPKEIVVDQESITTNTAEEVNRIKSLPTETEDGATFNLDGTKYDQGGLVVPVDSMNTTSEEITPELISKFVEENKDKIGDENMVKVGIYKFPGSNKVSIDLNLVVPKEMRESALEFGKMAGQESLFDLETFENIKTGATGESPIKFNPEQFRQIATDLNKGIVPQVFGTEATIQEPIKLEKEVYTTEDIQALANESDKTTTPLSKKIVTDAANVIKALSSIANTKVNIHSTEASYNQSMQDNLTEEDVAEGTGTSGYYIDSKGEIHISLPNIESNTIYHEGAHPVLNFMMKQDPAVVNRMNSQIESLAKRNKSVKDVSNWAKDNYSADVAKEEKVVEFIARVADGTIDLATLDKGSFNKAKSIINEFLALILGPNAPILNTVDEVINAAKNISESFKTGRELEATELTREIAAPKKAEVKAKEKAPAIQEVEEIKEMIDTTDNPMPVEGVRFKKDIKIDAKALKIKERPGRRVGRGLSVKSVNNKKVKEETDKLSIDYVRENAPAAFIKNANIIRTYPIVSAITKFKEVKTVEEAQAVYDVFVKELSDNLIYLIDEFKPEFREISTLWYDGANIFANELASKYGVSTEQVSGIIASLSPQKDWYQNVKLAELVLMSFKNNPVLTDKMIAMQRKIADEGLKEYRKKVKKGEVTLEKYKQKEKNVDEVIKNLSNFVGMSLNEVPDDIKSYIIRLDNEVNGSKDYDVLSPDGQVLGTATTKDGSKAKVAWGSYSEISKAVSIYLDGSQENISSSLGDMHKIRNFYNNIIDPMSKDGDVTIDTHAVAAALMLPLSGNSKQVSQNFGTGTSNSGPFGIKGLYYAYSDAYAKAAEQTGLLPRQVQSITWEAVRGLFTDTFKRNKAEVSKINKIWDNYNNGNITINEAREQIIKSAGGIKDPTWAESISTESLENAKKADIGRRSGHTRQDIVGAEPGPEIGVGRKKKGSFKKPSKGETLVPKSYKIDTDGEGNFLFYHYGNMKGNNVDPKYFGKNRYTSDKRSNSVSYFYTRANEKETMVSGDVNVVKVPMEKVYPFNKDPLNFYDQAEANFRKDFPNGAFDAAKQIDYMNPLIQAAGFDMTVAQWETFPLRAETTKALPIDKKLTNAYREFGGLDVADMRDKFEIDILNKLSDAAQKMTRKGEIIRDKFYGMGGTDAPVKKLMKDKDLRDAAGKSIFEKWNNTLPEKQKVRFKKPSERAVPVAEKSENFAGEETNKWTMKNGFTIEESGIGGDKVFIIKKDGQKYATALTLAEATSMVNNRARFKKPEKKYGDTIQRYMEDPNQPQMIKDVIENTSDLNFTEVKFPIINEAANSILAEAIANNELDKLITDLESTSKSKDVSGPFKIFLLQKALEVAKLSNNTSLAQKILLKLNEISSDAGRTLRALVSNTIPESVMYSLNKRLKGARDKKIGKDRLASLEKLFGDIQDILDSSIDETMNEAEIEALILRAIENGEVFPISQEEYNNLTAEIGTLTAQLAAAISQARSQSPTKVYTINLPTAKKVTLTNKNNNTSKTVDEIINELAAKVMMRGNITEKSFTEELSILFNKLGLAFTDTEVKDIYNQARKNPEVQEMLANMGVSRGKAPGQEISEKALKDLLSMVKKRISEFAKNHWNGNATQVRNFRNEILEIFGPDSQIGQEIADKVEKLFNDKVKAAAEKVIQKELGSSRLPSKTQKQAQTITEKMVRHIYAGENAGVLDTDMFINLFADKYGFTSLTEEQMGVLREFADYMAYTAPGSFERKKWMARMELYANKISTPRWKFVLGVFAVENFYANVLSGYTTLWRANTGVIYSSLGELAVESMIQGLSNPKMIFGKSGLMYGLRRMLDAAKNQGWNQLGQYMKDGVPITTKYENVQIGAITNEYNRDKERSTLKDKNIALEIGKKAFRSIYWPVAMMSRTIAAMDGIITAPIREYFAKNAAINQLLREGMDPSDAKFFEAMEKLLYRDKSAIDQARAQAEEEFAALKKIDPKLSKLGFRTSSNYVKQRTYEILDSYRSDYIQEYSEEMQARSRLMGQPMGTAGVLYEALTFLQRKLPGFTYITPFARVPLNALNEWVSWGPYGLIRGTLGKGAVSRAFRTGLTKEPADHLKFGKTIWNAVGTKEGARENVRDLIKGTIGTAIMAAPLIMAMAAKTGEEDEEKERGGTKLKTYQNLPFRITSAKPENVDYRYLNELRERNLWFPNSFRVKVGKFDTGWINYLDMPYAASLSPAGYIMDNKFVSTVPLEDNILYDKAVTDQVAMSMLPYVTFIKNQTFIKGIVDFATIFAEEKNMQQQPEFSAAKSGAAALKFGTGILKGLIYPNFYKQTYVTYKSFAGEDQKVPYRITPEDIDPIRYVNESMAYNFPFWENGIENKAYDSFGLPVQEDIAYNRVGDALLNNVMWQYVIPNTPLEYIRSFYYSREGDKAWDFVIERQLEIPRIDGESDLTYDENVKYKKLALGYLYNATKYFMDNRYEDNTITVLSLRELESKSDIQSVLKELASQAKVYARNEMLLETAKTPEEKNALLQVIETQAWEDLQNGDPTRWTVYNRKFDPRAMDSPVIESPTKMRRTPERR